MINSRLILVFVLFFFFSGVAKGSIIEIKAKVKNEIITNIDIENEKKYLIFLNPRLVELDKNRIQRVSKDSLITEIIKKK